MVLRDLQLIGYTEIEEYPISKGYPLFLFVIVTYHL